MYKNRDINILVAAGGTGGHLFPALAVVEQLEKITSYRMKASFVGNPQKMEARIVPDLGFKFYKIPVTGFSGLFSVNTVMLPIKIFRSILTCRSLINKLKIDAVLCAGAYISYPAGIAAHQERVPLILMESNVNPGKTIRFLSSKCDMMITAFDETANFFPSDIRKKIVSLGNPVREQILTLPAPRIAKKQFGLDPDKKTILIFGGSLGAKSINMAAEIAINYFAESEFQFIWQVGENYPLTGTIPENVRVMKFIDNMANAYAASDLVICRSGATTVAELTVVGKPSILIPLPTASNNEQEHNARVLEEKGAAFMVENSAISDCIIELISKLMNDASALDLMSSAVKTLAKPDAAFNSAIKILELIK